MPCRWRARATPDASWCRRFLGRAIASRRLRALPCQALSVLAPALGHARLSERHGGFGRALTEPHLVERDVDLAQILLKDPHQRRVIGARAARQLTEHADERMRVVLGEKGAPHAQRRVLLLPEARALDTPKLLEA